MTTHYVPFDQLTDQDLGGIVEWWMRRLDCVWRTPDGYLMAKVDGQVLSMSATADEQMPILLGNNAGLC